MNYKELLAEANNIEVTRQSQATEEGKGYNPNQRDEIEVRAI